MIHTLDTAFYLKSFKIDNKSIGLFKSHAKCHETINKKKDDVKSFLAQRTIVFDDSNLNLTKKSTCILSAHEEVTKVEVLDTLHFVKAKPSFTHISGNAEMYRLVLGKRNHVASAYQMYETKVAYVIKFGIAQYVRRKLIKDIADTPFSYLFNEAINSQVKKQYDRCCVLV